MITKHFWRSGDAGLPILLGVLVMLTALGGEPLRALLRYERIAVGHGEWWRLLSAHLVHLNLWHTLLNVLGLVTLALLCPQRLPWTLMLRRLLWLGFGVSLCLYHFAPAVPDYVGLSGVLHGLFVLGLVPPALRADRYALAALALLLAKLVAEQVWGASAAEGELIGGYVVTQAHLYGAVLALAYGIFFGSFGGREAARLERYTQQQESSPRNST